MVNTPDKKNQKIRFIKISTLTKHEIFNSYKQCKSYPIYELKTNLWRAIAQWDDELYIKLGSGKDYDGTLISIVLGADKKGNLDYSELEQLLSLIYGIKQEGKKVYVCFRQESGNANKNYFKLSAYLTLWAVQTNMYDDIRFFDTTVVGGLPKRLAARYKKSRKYTACVSDEHAPIVAIFNEVYSILDSVYVIPENNKKDELTRTLSNLRAETGYEGAEHDKVFDPNAYLEAYFYAYIEKTLSEWAQNKLWTEFVSSYRPSLLVAALLATVIKGLPLNKKRTLFNKKSNNWVALIEHSYSYAQGILQLIDNANRHVVEADKKNGAFFGFNIRHDKENILNMKSQNVQSVFHDCNYFLQVFVVDCDYSDRDKKGNNFDESETPIGIVARYNRALKKAHSSDGISSLQEVFDYPQVKSVTLDNYYKNEDNLAFHYGLQIFSDVISSGHGSLTVVSGKESADAIELAKMTYSNSKDRTTLDYIQFADDIEFHFSGTAYNIFLPAVMSETDNNEYNFFLGNEPIWDEKYNPIIENGNKVFTIAPMVDINRFGIYSAKEYFKEYGGEPIINIDFSTIKSRKQIEIACKCFLVCLIQNKTAKALCLTGFANEFSMLDAVRVVSLFYNKIGSLDKIKSKGIFLYCEYNENEEEKDFELYFSGASWSSVVENIHRQKLVRNIPELFVREVSAIKFDTCKTNGYDSGDERPLTAAIIKYYLRVGNSKNTIIQKQIKDILSSNVHEIPLGCRIPETHVRIGRVHLDTFYEAQFLFGNAYCTDIFAIYVADRVNKQISGNNYSNIVLYGYETYSTLTLYKAQNFLGRGYMLVYEKINDRVRYLKKELFNVKKSSRKNKTLVVYVMGISSTLSTFKQMNEAFRKACEEEGVTFTDLDMDNMYLSVIQIDGEGSEKFISHPMGDLFSYESKEPYKFTESAIDGRAHFFVSVPSVWYAAEEEDCIHCLPEHNKHYSKCASKDLAFLAERPLIEVDETSVVPTQMIFLNEEKNGKEEVRRDDGCGRDNAKFFLENEDNKLFLRYGHVERYDNHFQYFFRIAALYHSKQILPNDKNNETKKKQLGEIGIELWLKRIKDNYSDVFDMSGKTVNILIAPQHFSNTGYVNSVARCVFNGTAHIIELDIRKEYRSNFRTKYSNYRELSKYIKKYGTDYKLNFYYVNDQIVTGKTFSRAESLINTLLDKYGVQQNGKVFRGVFTLVDRNSYSTRKSYVDSHLRKSGEEYLPYFSYLRFSIPSLRNHDNSCPLCGQNNEAEKIVASAALTSTAHYWQEKIVYHKQRTSDEMRYIDSKWKSLDEKAYEEKKLRNFRRLQCENGLWNAISNITDEKEIYNKIVETILVHYPSYTQYLKQERKLGNKSLDTVGIQNVGDIKPLPEEILLRSVKDLPWNTYRHLFRMVIARLCAVGSCVLLNHQRLIGCLDIGNSLDKKVKDLCSQHEDTYGEYLISYIKVMSRPLLFYREPVKSAVLKLLLKLFTTICSDAKDRLQLLEEDTSNIHYDETFKGFLLNALKRLLCYDKGYSKCNYCDKYAFKTDENNSAMFEDELYGDFFKRLYVENNRKARNIVEADLGSGSIFGAEFGEGKTVRECDKNGDIESKYTGMSCCLKKYCGKNKQMQIVFFVANGDELSNLGSDNKSNKRYVCIGGDKTLPAPEMKDCEDFCFQNGIYYVRIGNNYNRFKEPSKIAGNYSNEVYNYCKELGLIQDAYVIIGVKTSDLEELRKILAFRKEILREAERDFNNGVVNRLISARQLVQALTRDAYVSHTSNPRIGFIATVLRVSDIIQICNSESTKEMNTVLNTALYSALYSAIELYMETMIPVLFKDLIKRNVDTIRVKDRGATVDGLPIGYERSEAFLNPDISKNNSIDACKAIDFAVKMLKFKYGTEGVKFLYRDSDKPQDNEVSLFDNCDRIAELFGDFQFVGWFIGDIEEPDRLEQYFEPFMIINTLIKNAEKYGENITVVFEKKSKLSFDLIVENTYTESRRNSSGRGMTLKALGNYFGTKEPKDCEMTCFAHEPDKNKTKFAVTIKNYCILKDSEKRRALWEKLS